MHAGSPNLSLRRLGTYVLAAMVLLSGILTAVHFPYATDPEGDHSRAGHLQSYYKSAYQAPPEPASPAPAPDASEADYVRMAREAAGSKQVPENVRAFVKQYGLEQKRVLEIGAGSGLLQDIVPDYTGLDISPAARRFFHKPFVLASATAMPFPDHSFDAAWSIWVLEHIPNPERALLEMRRVLKPGGYLYFQPAWDSSPYAAQGYPVRPYSDFDWKGKIVKATLPVYHSTAYRLLHRRQTLVLRSLAAHLTPGPSRLHFTRLTPNYKDYWMGDSDAVVSLRYHELYLWFATRGDECLNCPSEPALIFGRSPNEAMILRIRK